MRQVWIMPDSCCTRKSKRYVTVQKAKGQLFGKLNKGIRKVAVTVAPERALIEDIGRAGFDLCCRCMAWTPQRRADRSADEAAGVAGSQPP